MTITQEVAKNIIRKLLKGEDYRIEVVTIIDASFLDFTIVFFKKVFDAKYENRKIDLDWYKKEFLKDSLPPKEIAINAGLNKKTIHNMFNSSKRQVVIDASNDHYDVLYSSINKLIEAEHDVELTLTIKFRGVSVDLNVSESLIVINSLAVKRAELRGGLWSSAGKRVEKPLMQVLCKLFGVPQTNYALKIKGKGSKKPEFEREIDFYLIGDGTEHKCEVKLMGRGNPESADVIFARKSKVFIADKLSDTNIKQLDSENVEWIQLRSDQGFKKFEEVLAKLGIPHSNLSDNWENELEELFEDIFQ